MILVDSSVLLDVLTADPRWADWSVQRLDEWSRRGALCIDPIVHAELSARFESIESLEKVIQEAALQYEELPRDALFLAARAHLAYRSRGGTRTGVLPDFFIGAHAAVNGWPLLTREVGRYRSYFPSVDLVSPGE